MRKLKIYLLFSLLVCFFSILTATAQTPSTVTEQKKTIEVVRFGIKEKVEFPEAAVEVMMAEVVDELKKLKKYDDVILTGPTAAAAAPTAVAANADPQISTAGQPETVSPKAAIQLTGTIIQYKPGNRTARYLIGFGAGMTKVLVHVKFVETATGKVLLEKDMDGKVVIGLFGGDGNGATRGLAKEIAKNARKIS